MGGHQQYNVLPPPSGSGFFEVSLHSVAAVLRHLCAVETALVVIVFLVFYLMAQHSQVLLSAFLPAQPHLLLGGSRSAAANTAHVDGFWSCGRVVG